MPEGPDVYSSMTELYDNETEGVHYTKEWYQHRWRYKTFQDYKRENEIFIMAPHGGSIESGTTELALATAGFVNSFNGQLLTQDRYDYFIFNGTNPKNENGRLHVTASHYDDTAANKLVGESLISLAFHGCTDAQPLQTTGEGYSACLIGGLDQPFKQQLAFCLQEQGFNAFITSQEVLNGDLPDNIINRNSRSAGAQFEMTTTFRKSLYTINNRKKRRATTRPQFWLFVNTVRAAVEQYRIQLTA